MTTTMIAVAAALALIGVVTMVRGKKAPAPPKKLTDEEIIEAREHARRARVLAIVNDDTTHFWSK